MEAILITCIKEQNQKNDLGCGLVIQENAISLYTHLKLGERTFCCNNWIAAVIKKS
jgi:hypothetical protein